MVLFLLGIAAVSTLIVLVLADLPRSVVVGILVMSIVGAVASKVVPPIFKYRMERLKRVGGAARPKPKRRKQRASTTGLRIIEGNDAQAQHRI